MNRIIIIVSLLLINTMSYSQYYWHQTGHLIGDTINNNVGFSVSMNKYGNVIIEGGAYNEYSKGEIKVFEFKNGFWEKTGNIKGTNDNSYFGFSVDINADGSIIIIGAPYDDTNGEDAGAVYVYKNLNGNWQLLDTVLYGENPGDNFGYSVSINSNGLIIAASSIYDNDKGSIKVLKFENDNWEQIGDKIFGESSDGYFGHNISMNSEGTIIAGGAIYGGINNGGYVKVYQYISNIWSQKGNTLYGDAYMDWFSAVSLNSLGNVIAIGAYTNDENGNDAGQVKVFSFNSNNWEQIGSNILGDAAEDKFGIATALNSQGDILIVSGVSNDNYSNNAGQVKVFKNIANNWVQVGNSLYGDNTNDNLGWDVSIDSSGTNITSTALYGQVNGSSSGYVNVYNYTCNSYSYITDSSCNYYISSNNQFIDSTGIYIDTLQSMNGCDSIVYMNITINKVDTSVLVTDSSLTANAIGEYQWINCETGINIENETNAMFIPSENGSYSVIIDDGNCIDTSACFSFNNIYVKNINNKDFEIFPNPTKNFLNIKTNNNEISRINIISISGEILINEVFYNSIKLETKKLNKGMYILKIKTSDNVISKKIIIN